MYELNNARRTCEAAEDIGVAVDAAEVVAEGIQKVDCSVRGRRSPVDS